MHYDLKRSIGLAEGDLNSVINNSVGRVNELLNSKVHHGSHVESYEALRNSVKSSENYHF